MKPLRPNLLAPATTNLLLKYESLDRWYQALWINWPFETANIHALLTLAYTSLLIDSGQSKESAVDLIGSLDVSSEDPIQSLAIPAQRFEISDRWSNITLAFRSALVLEALRYAWKKTDHRKYNANTKISARRLQDAIEQSYNTISSTFDTPEPWPSFSELSRAAKWIAACRGFDPYLIKIYEGNIRPVDEPLIGHYSLLGITQEHRTTVLKKFEPTKRDVLSQASSLTLPPSKMVEVSESWIREARTLLRQLCSDLRSSIRNKADSQLKQERALAIVQEYYLKANTIAPEDSALHWGIRYAKFAFVDNPNIQAKSLRDYLDRCVINGLLRNPKSTYLSSWEPEDFLDSFEERTSLKKLSPRSKQSTVQAYIAFYRFLSRHMNIPKIDCRELKEQMTFGAGQWRLIPPEAIDALIAQLHRSKDIRLRQVSAVIGLAFYGGLRAAEIGNLTASNIAYEIDLPFLDVETLRGKSENARRRLPLDALAPVYLQELLISAAGLRHQASRSKRFDEIALFGPDSSATGYESRHLGQLANNILRTTFGVGMSLHTLRHCFCSNLFLRWYGLRFPDVFNNLKSRGHELFQPALQNRLNEYFNCMPIEDGEIRPYDLISMIKLTGHASPDTLLTIYVHCLHIIQKHAVERIDELNNVRSLPDSVMVGLFQKMKSPASRAKFRRALSNR